MIIEIPDDDKRSVLFRTNVYVAYINKPNIFTIIQQVACAFLCVNEMHFDERTFLRIFNLHICAPSSLTTQIIMHT